VGRFGFPLIRFTVVFLLTLFIGRANEALAFSLAGLPLNASDFSSLFPQDISNAIIKTVGIYGGHRPYESATPLGSKGWDFGIEVTLVRIPDDFNNVLAEYAQGGAGTSLVPALPVAKIQLRKGFGDSVNVGGSYIGYQTNMVIGGDFQVTMDTPEEGLSWALRLNYTYTSISFVTARSIAPEIVFSRKLEFADPYFGGGVQYIWGAINMILNVSAGEGIQLPPGVSAPSIQIPLNTTGSGVDGYAFSGVSMRVPNLGLKVTLEGSFNFSGADTIGGKVGFEF
jgi:hypothetical protein